jgi:hypothetical protein
MNDGDLLAAVPVVVVSVEAIRVAAGDTDRTLDVARPIATAPKQSTSAPGGMQGLYPGVQLAGAG